MYFAHDNLLNTGTCNIVSKKLTVQANDYQLEILLILKGLNQAVSWYIKSTNLNENKPAKKRKMHTFNIIISSLF
jgi:hypothetical protein